jgi:hypothetical protein
MTQENFIFPRRCISPYIFSSSLSDSWELQNVQFSHLIPHTLFNIPYCVCTCLSWHIQSFKSLHQYLPHISFFQYLFFNFVLFYFLHSIVHSLPPLPPATLQLLHIPHLLPSPPPCGCPHPQAHMTSKFPGASSLLRVRCIISEWAPTLNSSTPCVLGASYLLVYAVCLVVQCLLVLLQDHPSPHLLSAFSNSSTEVSCFCPLVSSKHLHLILSAACWVFQRTVWKIPFCECSMASVILSGLGTSPWSGSHFGPVAGPSFPQVPLYFYPCNSSRQEELWVRDVTVGWQPHPSLDVLSFCWRWALPTLGRFI